MGKISGGLVAARLTILIALMGAWEGAVYLDNSLSFFIGSPQSVFHELVALAADGLHWHLLITGGEAATGLVLGTLAGTCCGLALWYTPGLARAAQPFVVAVGAFPILALAPLMILWFGIGFGMKVALAVFSTFFVAMAQAFHGASAVDRRYVDFLAGMRASRRQIFSKVVVPGSLEWVFSSMRINVGLALLGAFIGEFIASNAGLGHLILRASSLYDVPRALAASFCVIILAAVFDAFGRAVQERRHSIIQFIAVPRHLAGIGGTPDS